MTNKSLMYFIIAFIIAIIAYVLMFISHWYTHFIFFRVSYETGEERMTQLVEFYDLEIRSWNFISIRHPASHLLASFNVASLEFSRRAIRYMRYDIHDPISLATFYFLLLIIMRCVDRIARRRRLLSFFFFRSAVTLLDVPIVAN